ncbi:MAG: RNA polymerase sigma factor [Pseudomonadota bacterium]
MTSDADASARAAKFSKLIEPQFDRLFRLAQRLTGNRADAEDLLQETLTRLYADVDALDHVEDPAPYLRRVLYNRFVDQHRARARRPLILVDDDSLLDRVAPESEANPDTLDAAARRQERLLRALARLSETHRVLVLLHDAEGYTLRELEAMTGTPTGTLKSRLSRARARLRELLWEDRDDQALTGAEDDADNTTTTARKEREPFGPSRRAEG